MSDLVANFNYGPTMGDLMEYIQTAERKEFGYHIPWADAPEWVFHIYDGRRQVNLVWNGKTLVNFVFDDDDVAVYKVTNEIAEYDNPRRYPLDTKIGNGKEWAVDFDNRVEFCSILLDVLSPFVVERQRKLTEARNAELEAARERAREIAKIGKWGLMADDLNEKIERFNTIKKGYIRNCGTLYMVDPSTEYVLERLCKEILDVVESLNGGDSLEWFKANRPDVITTLDTVARLVNIELGNIDEAKKFIGGYGINW